jgi:circadian clock protein KaiC
MEQKSMKQLQTGIGGLDDILDGGIPEKKVIMLTGYAGTGKTIFSTQFLVGGIKNQQAAVYVTFEETAQEIIDNTQNFGWNLESLIKEKKLIFVEVFASEESVRIVREVDDLTPLIERIKLAIKKNSAKRVVLDSITALLMALKSKDVVRRELHRLCAILKKMECTILMISEVPEVSFEQASAVLSRYGVEEFVADGLITLYFRPEAEGMTRERYIEVRKMRGVHHKIGVYPFEITNHGVVIKPRA